MAKNPLLELKEQGQSVWLDNLSRPLIHTGALERLIHEDGISGVTSNPAIFKAAMSEGEAYDQQIAQLAAAGHSAAEVYEALAVKDIQDAADVLRPVYDATGGGDGYVSLEVSPHLARETQATVDEAQRLWAAVKRPNVLIKIPGTEEGVPAIQACLAQGINVNVTLLFSLHAHQAVIEAHTRAMESRHQRGEDIGSVVSVASFFLSRIDVLVDGMLDEMIASGANTEEARSLKGKVALASAKLAYHQWKKMCAEDRWVQLAESGARVQKPLWASTSTKNPDYSDVMYVEPLIGPDTINTLPENTVEAFRDHGKAAATVEDGVDEARAVMDRLAGIGINIDAVTDQLVVEGIDKFVKPFESLMKTLEAKRVALMPSRDTARP